LFGSKVHGRREKKPPGGKVTCSHADWPDEVAGTGIEVDVGVEGEVKV
jgi:hypothetical protein